MSDDSVTVTPSQFLFHTYKGVPYIFLASWACIIIGGVLLSLFFFQRRVFSTTVAEKNYTITENTRMIYLYGAIGLAAIGLLLVAVDSWEYFRIFKRFELSFPVFFFFLVGLFAIALSVISTIFIIKNKTNRRCADLSDKLKNIDYVYDETRDPNTCSVVCISGQVPIGATCIPGCQESSCKCPSPQKPRCVGNVCKCCDKDGKCCCPIGTPCLNGECCKNPCGSVCCNGINEECSGDNTCVSYCRPVNMASGGFKYDPNSNLCVQHVEKATFEKFYNALKTDDQKIDDYFTTVFLQNVYQDDDKKNYEILLVKDPSKEVLTQEDVTTDIDEIKDIILKGDLNYELTFVGKTNDKKCNPSVAYYPVVNQKHCCFPSHLFLGDIANNIRATPTDIQIVTKDNNAKLYCPNLDDPLFADTCVNDEQITKDGWSKQQSISTITKPQMESLASLHTPFIYGDKKSEGIFFKLESYADGCDVIQALNDDGEANKYFYSDGKNTVVLREYKCDSYVNKHSDDQGYFNDPPDSQTRTTINYGCNDGLCAPLPTIIRIAFNLSKIAPEMIGFFETMMNQPSSEGGVQALSAYSQSIQTQSVSNAPVYAGDSLYIDWTRFQSSWFRKPDPMKQKIFTTDTGFTMRRMAKDDTGSIFNLTNLFDQATITDFEDRGRSFSLFIFDTPDTGNHFIIGCNQSKNCNDYLFRLRLRNDNDPTFYTLGYDEPKNKFTFSEDKPVYFRFVIPTYQGNFGIMDYLQNYHPELLGFNDPNSIQNFFAFYDTPYYLLFQKPNDTKWYIVQFPESGMEVSEYDETKGFSSDAVDAFVRIMSLTNAQNVQYRPRTIYKPKTFIPVRTGRTFIIISLIILIISFLVGSLFYLNNVRS